MHSDNCRYYIAAHGKVLHTTASKQLSAQWQWDVATALPLSLSHLHCIEDIGLLAPRWKEVELEGEETPAS